MRTATKPLLCVATVGLFFLIGCFANPKPSNVSATNAASADGEKVAMISITSDPKADPQAVNMGLTFAGFCVDEGYKVAIFFNVKGIKLPTKDFPTDFKYQSHSPFIDQLKKLKSRGVELHVCPVCMKDLNITKDDVIEEAFVTDKPKLFANLGSDTMVFTY